MATRASVSLARAQVTAAGDTAQNDQQKRAHAIGAAAMFASSGNGLRRIARMSASPCTRTMLTMPHGSQLTHRSAPRRLGTARAPLRGADVPEQARSTAGWAN